MLIPLLTCDQRATQKSEKDMLGGIRGHRP